MPRLGHFFVRETTLPTAAKPPEANAHYLRDVQSALRDGNSAMAASIVDSWLRAAPEDTEALYFCAVVERTSGKLQQASATLATLLNKDPLHTRALQESGHVHKRLGESSAALVDYQRATRINPALTASWSAMSEILAGMGQADAARQAEEQMKYLKSLPPPLVIVMDLIARGRLGKAEQLCKRFMLKNPQHVDGMRLLAEIATKMGALNEADVLLSAAERLSPDNSAVTADYIQLLRRRHRFDDAISRARNLVERDPDNLKFQSLAAIEHMQVGDYDAALAGFHEVLKRVPNDPVTLTSTGHVLKTCGKTQEAIERYRAAIASQTTYGEAWYSLSNLKTYTFSEADIATMRSCVESSQLDHGSRVFFHFALGKSFEDQGDFATSFDHYRLGNAAKRRQSNYDAARITEELQQQRAVCSAALFEEFRGAGNTAPDPIFIVGLPRAGSTLLEQILASHSLVDGTLELPNVLSLAQDLRRRSDATPYPDILKTLSFKDYRAFGDAFMTETAIHRQGAPYFIDKMPNNFRHIGLIKLMLPNAKIIDARRNPMACCFSGYKQLFAEGQEFSYELTDIGHYYRDYVELMKHWNSVLPGQILQINNEDVIADLEGQVRRLLDFCGLPFEAQCLRYWETDRAVKTPSSEQVRRPVTDVGQHQWKNFAPWLAPLEQALGPDLAAQSHR